MDVSAVTSRSEVSVVIAASTPRPADHPPPRPEPRVSQSPDRFAGPDPSEAVAERMRAGIDTTRTSDELWIPAWVRVAYAARARRGWFLPAPTDLAGYGEEE
ncbi:MAG: hypothetical protein ACRDJP_13415 [Actinomycetota bacterium]